jgi:drug/metabolite transporter (DMT)-like permease
MAGGRGTVLLIMLVAVVALAVGETALSKGMKQIDRLQGVRLDQAVALVRNGWVAAGLLLLLAHLGLYMLALKSADLSFALPLTAGSYPLAALLARFYLHEDVSLSRVLGTLLITVGVAIVVLGEPGGLWSRPRAAQPAPSPPPAPAPAGPLET